MRFSYLAVLFVAGLISSLMLGAVIDTGYSSVFVKFSMPTKFHDVIANGEYLISHNNEAGPGEPCFSLFKSKDGRPDHLVTTFHCTGIERDLAQEPRFAIREVRPGLNEVTEVQFAGSTTGHRILGTAHPE